MASRSGCTRSEAVSGSPDMVIGTSSAPPSWDGTGVAHRGDPGDLPQPGRRVVGRGLRRGLVQRAGARGDQDVLHRRARRSSPPSTISWPGPPRRSPCPASVASFSPAALPPTKHTATNTTHSAIARHGCSALHRANRTVTGLPAHLRFPLHASAPLPTVLTLGADGARTSGNGPGSPRNHAAGGSVAGVDRTTGRARPGIQPGAPRRGTPAQPRAGSGSSPKGTPGARLAARAAVRRPVHERLAADRRAAAAAGLALAAVDVAATGRSSRSRR